MGYRPTRQNWVYAAKIEKWLHILIQKAYNLTKEMNTKNDNKQKLPTTKKYPKNNEFEFTKLKTYQNDELQPNQKNWIGTKQSEL